jgi:hypothetical protein
VYFNGTRRVRARAPVAYARHGRASQRISWRLVVQALRSDDQVWVGYAKSPWQARRATPARSADFRGMRLKTDPWEDDWTRGFRAKLQLRWYAADDTSVAGRATLYVDHYQLIEDKPLGIDTNGCNTTTG